MQEEQVILEFAEEALEASNQTDETLHEQAMQTAPLSPPLSQPHIFRASGASSAADACALVPPALPAPAVAASADTSAEAERGLSRRTNGAAHFSAGHSKGGRELRSFGKLFHTIHRAGQTEPTSVHRVCAYHPGCFRHLYLGTGTGRIGVSEVCRRLDAWEEWGREHAPDGDSHRHAGAAKQLSGW